MEPIVQVVRRTLSRPQVSSIRAPYSLLHLTLRKMRIFHRSKGVCALPTLTAKTKKDVGKPKPKAKVRRIKTPKPKIRFMIWHVKTELFKGIQPHWRRIQEDSRTRGDQTRPGRATSTLCILRRNNTADERKGSMPSTITHYEGQDLQRCWSTGMFLSHYAFVEPSFGVDDG